MLSSSHILTLCSLMCKALLSPLLLGPDPAATLGTALDPLSDAQCNLRLAVFLLDRVLFGLFPELAGAP